MEKLLGGGVKAKQSGNKVIVNNNVIEFLKDRSIIYNGKIFKNKNLPADLMFESIISDLKPKTSIYKIFMPDVYAANPFDMKILAAVIFVAYEATRMYAPYIAGIVGVGVVANEGWEYYKNGEITCDKEKFKIRLKKRNSLHMATSEAKELPLEAIKNVLNDNNIKGCTSNISLKLNEQLSKEQRIDLESKKPLSVPAISK